MDGIEMEVAALERRDEAQLVADADVDHCIQIFWHRDVGLAARIERDKQQAARRQPLFSQLLESEDDRGGVSIVVHTRREHRRDGTTIGRRS